MGRGAIPAPHVRITAVPSSFGGSSSWSQVAADMHAPTGSADHSGWGGSGVPAAWSPLLSAPLIFGFSGLAALAPQLREITGSLFKEIQVTH